ncbi:MAG: hypothetical protein ACRDH6_06815 [Actinomycetota bacterium]
MRRGAVPLATPVPSTLTGATPGSRDRLRGSDADGLSIVLGLVRVHIILFVAG